MQLDAIFLCNNWRAISTKAWSQMFSVFAALLTNCLCIVEQKRQNLFFMCDNMSIFVLTSTDAEILICSPPALKTFRTSTVESMVQEWDSK